MTLRCEPATAQLGTDVLIAGDGLPPATHYGEGECEVPGIEHEGDHVHDGYLRVTVNYPNRSESTKAVVAWEGHPVYAAGAVSFTLRAEELGHAEVTIWDWGGFRELDRGSFEVTDGG